MQNKNTNPHPDRLLFPIDLLTTIKATGGVETFRVLRDFVTNQVVINLDEDFMNDPEIRQEYQDAILLLNDLVSSIDRNKNTNHDQDIIETVKYLENQRITIIAEMEVSNG